MRKTPFDGLRANGARFDFKGLFPFALSPSKGEVAFIDSLSQRDHRDSNRHKRGEAN